MDKKLTITVTVIGDDVRVVTEHHNLNCLELMGCREYLIKAADRLVTGTPNLASDGE